MDVISVSRVKLDKQGYDECGRYFGVGEKLWYVDGHAESGYVRAASKADVFAAVMRYGVNRLNTYGIAECVRMFGYSAA